VVSATLARVVITPSAFATRAVAALRRPYNWIQLAKFAAVGAVGYVVNLVVYALLLGIGAHRAAAVSFVVSAANNYWWNRHWTFAHQKGHFGYQGMRFFVVSVGAFLVNQLWLLVFLDWIGLGKIVSQAIAIVLVTPLNFVGNKLWSFRVRGVTTPRRRETEAAPRAPGAPEP
jgi:putative flippase GtrA